MADGEIEVSVRADGVDDAAGELGGDGDGPGGGGMADGGDGRSGGQGNAFMKLLGRIAGLLVFLGPILDAVGVITNILTAFVAPLAVVLLRLLQPAIRLLLAVLPIWFEFVGFLDTVVQELLELRNRVVGTLLSLLGISNPIEAVRDGVDSVKTAVGNVWDMLKNMLEAVRDGFDSVKTAVGNVWDMLKNIPEAVRDGVDSVKTTVGNVWDTLKSMLEAVRNLPSNIADRLPSAGDVGGRAREGIGNAVLGDDDSRRRQAVNIGIGGGLEPFIDRLTRDGSVDFP